MSIQDRVGIIEGESDLGTELARIVTAGPVYRNEASQRDFNEVDAHIMQVEEDDVMWPPAGSVTIITGRRESDILRAFRDFEKPSMYLTSIELDYIANQIQSPDVKLPSSSEVESVGVLTELISESGSLLEPIPTDLSNWDFSVLVLPFAGGQLEQTSLRARYYVTPEFQHSHLSTVILVRQPHLNHLERLVGGAIPGETINGPLGLKWDETVRFCAGAVFATVTAGLIVAGAGYAAYRYMHRNDSPADIPMEPSEWAERADSTALLETIETQSNLDVLLRARAEMVGSRSS